MADSRPPRDQGGTGGSQGPREPGGLWSLAFTSGLTLLAGFFVGYYGGRWLDGALGTTPWLTLVGTILGIVAGFRVLLRDILREASRESKPDPNAEGSRRKPDRD